MRKKLFVIFAVLLFFSIATSALLNPKYAFIKKVGAQTATPTSTPLPAVCNPDNTGSSFNIIDNLDFTYWAKELMGIFTSKNSDCLQNNTIDIFDFNKMRDIKFF